MLWRAWAVSAAALALTLSFLLFADAATWAGRGIPVKTAFSPGDLSDGHYQIEERCDLCHPRTGKTMQEACLDCHRAGLTHARDTHPTDLYTDAHAAQIARIDARQCVTCHDEHRPEITDAASVSVAGQFCRECHGRITQSSASHVGLTFNLCTGCHNYHDNRVQAPSFRQAHEGAPRLLPQPRVPPPFARTGPVVRPHTESVVGACDDCHAPAVETFLQGRKGMRLAVGLPPVTPAQSRSAMHPHAAHRPLRCDACHDPARDDTPAIAVETCMECHDSAHVRSYPGSPHHRLWQQEIAGAIAPGSGVSCATCHFPREPDTDGALQTMHNPSRDLRPVDRMAATVCMHCHGLSYALDALADRRQSLENYRQAPGPRIHGIRARLGAAPPPGSPPH